MSRLFYFVCSCLYFLNTSAFRRLVHKLPRLPSLDAKDGVRVCVCVCACVSARARACVCVCVYTDRAQVDAQKPSSKALLRHY